MGGFPSWPKGADCKSAGNAFEGSNPSPPTNHETAEDIVISGFGFGISMGCSQVGKATDSDSVIPRFES